MKPFLLGTAEGGIEAEIDRAPLLASFFIDVCKPGGYQIDVIAVIITRFGLICKITLYIFRHR
jgi:hypothetical protein